MGIKDLWTILAPYCERRPIYELEGKIVAIDLAGWVCESLNVVDYFVHPRQYLKNLYFRTCYLLLAGVTPVFVLEGKAPELKAGVIAKRNEIQFRGVKPREPPKNGAQKTQKPVQGRTRFNFVLKKCEELLQCMGIECVQAPGEAEAYCAYLNKKGLVDGIISQDSDCFAYGAIRVYRNFSVSTQGTSSCHGGAVDIYDMRSVCKSLDFGQNKVIVLGLLCGCDYCPEGIGGVGRDSVLKFFNKYKNNEVLDRIKDWRKNDHKYTTLELRVDDKNICVNCGHIGKLYSHTRHGCSTCRTSAGCGDSWKEERLSIKSELILRKKALSNPEFPSEDIIHEFLNTPKETPMLDLRWKHPNLVKFVRQMGKLLQWPEIYSFQKFLPLLARWQIRCLSTNKMLMVNKAILRPKLIRKKRVLKGIPSYEVVWYDEHKDFEGLVPDEEISTFLSENGTVDNLWTTIEPCSVFDTAYSEIVDNFNALIESKKTKPAKKRTRKVRTPRKTKKRKNDSLRDMSQLMTAANEIEQELKTTKNMKKSSITKFFKVETPKTKRKKKPQFLMKNCSTPKIGNCLSDLEDDNESFNYSNIIREIVSNHNPVIKEHVGRKLQYEQVAYETMILDGSKDDMYLVEKPNSTLNKSLRKCMSNESLCEDMHYNIEKPICANKGLDTVVNRFLKRERKNSHTSIQQNHDVSLFFGPCEDGPDEFEKSLHLNPAALSSSDAEIDQENTSESTSS